MRRTKESDEMTRPKTKPTQPEGANQIELSTDEKAICARLIRVRRSNAYWLRYYIEHLLHMDATTADGVSPKQAADALEVMSNFAKWQTYFGSVTKTYAVLKDFPGLEWYPWDNSGKDEERLPRCTQKEQLEEELRELRALIQSPRGSFRPEAAEYADRLRKALDRMEQENRD
jgi:hypothetical protein